MNIVGVMSGTSLDGVDYVLTQVKGNKFDYKERHQVVFPKKLKEDLTSVAEGEKSFRESQKVHYKLGDFYYRSLKKIIEKKKWEPDLIGLHGQTVYHFPPLGTTQIGEPSYLKKLNVPVVSDFRSKLLVLKTQGAPLAPILHDKLMQDHTKKRKTWGFLNLGGMSNLTFKNKSGEMFASDFGTANIFLDKAAQSLFNKPYDKGGLLSLKGLPDYKIVLEYIKAHPYFKRKHPKSCGREDFSDKDYLKLVGKLKKLNDYDHLATLCEISLYPILAFLEANHCDTLVVSGGGAKNKYFMNRLKKELQGKVITSESLGWPVEAIEAGAFAYLAYAKIKNKSLNLSYLGLQKESQPLGRVD